MEARQRQLLYQVARAPNERAIAAALIDTGTEFTGAQAVGYYASRGPEEPNEVHVRGLSYQALEAYEKYGGTQIDPLIAQVRETHAPAEIDMELPSACTKEYREFSAGLDLGGLRQYLMAPVVVGVEMVGVMRFARCGAPRFGAPELAFAAALTLHVSARVGILRAMDSFASAWDEVLTSREREIAELAARGLSTFDAARVAGCSPNTIKRHLKSLYLKLGVSSRAELGAILLRGPTPFPRSPQATKRAIGEGSVLYTYG